jgi:hypothetical protein
MLYIRYVNRSPLVDHLCRTQKGPGFDSGLGQYNVMHKLAINKPISKYSQYLHKIRVARVGTILHTEEDKLGPN